jgi:hypothetical protein
MSEIPLLVIVGIDFGLTASGKHDKPTRVPLSITNYVLVGVAYWIEGQDNTIHVIHEWPGVHPTETIQSSHIEYKVPTKIAYDPRDDKPLWGFLCSNTDLPVHKYFKLYLDEYTLDRTYKSHLAEPPTIAQVEQWIRGFMAELLKYSKEILEPDVLKYSHSKTVEYEYHFSVPTTWSLVPIERFTHTINETMEEVYQKKSIRIGLTEAEAAANYVAVSYRNKLKVSHLEIDMAFF